MNLLYYWHKLFKKLRFSGIKNSKVHFTSKIESGTLFVNSVMNKYSFCGYDCEIINTEIGSFCSIANDVKIGGGEHPSNWVSTSPVFYSGRDSVKKKFSKFDRLDHKKTIIENDVWIGANVLVKQGVTIGNGAIVGMGSVVTHDIPPYAIAVGVPAKVIKYRFEPKVIGQLLKSNWWEVDEKILESVANKIKDPTEFITYLANEISNQK